MKFLAWCLGMAAMPSIAFAEVPAEITAPPPAEATPAEAPAPPPAEAPAPPPADTPATTPGYYYPPPAHVPTAEDRTQRLVLLDADIRNLNLRRDNIGSALPAALLMVGAVAAIGGLVQVSVHDGSGCPDDYQNGLWGSYSPCRQKETKPALIGAGVCVLGVALASVGIVFVAIRSSKRTRLARQISAKQSEANALRASQPRVGLSPTSGGGVLSVALRF